MIMMPKHLDHPLVPGCSTYTKPFPSKSANGMWAKIKTQTLSPEESFCYRRVFLSRRCLFKCSFSLLVGLCSAVKSGWDIIIDSQAMPTLGEPVCGRHNQFMPSLLIKKYIFIILILSLSSLHNEYKTIKFEYIGVLRIVTCL